MKNGNSRQQVLFYNSWKTHPSILFLFSSEGITHTWLKLYFLLGAILSSWWIWQQFKIKACSNYKTYYLPYGRIWKSHFNPQREWSSGSTGKRDPPGWWFGAEIQVHIKRRSLHRGQLQYPEYSSNSHGQGNRHFWTKPGGFCLPGGISSWKVQHVSFWRRPWLQTAAG